MILGDVRDKLYHTRERSRQLLSNGISDIPEEATFTDVEHVRNLYHLKTFMFFDPSLCLLLFVILYAVLGAS